MERNSLHEVELVPQSIEDLKKLIQEHSKNEGSLMWTCDDNDMQGIPLGEKCRKVNLSKLLQSQAESNTDKMFPFNKEVKKRACKIVPDERIKKMRYESQAESSTVKMFPLRKEVKMMACKIVPDELIEKKDKMQKMIGNDLTITIEDFENWSKTQRAHVLAAHPETLDQLTRSIVAARDMGLKIRCAGARHSWSSLFADPKQTLLHMEKMKSDYPNKRKIYMEKNQDNTVDVHIMAGVPNEEFKKFQLDNNVNLPANVILTIVQVASVIVTGCHGVGKDCSCPCDYVVQMRIVDSNGQLKTYTREKDGEQMMKAVIANFGLFGVVYDMTIRLKNEPTIVKTVNTYSSVETIFYKKDELENLIENNWSVELFWFPMNKCFWPFSYKPQNDEVWMRLINKDDTGKHKVMSDDYYQNRNDIDRVTSKMYGVAESLFKWPTAFPYVQQLAFFSLKKLMYPIRDDIYEKLPNAIHFRNYIENVPVYDMEFAFDLSKKKNYNVIRQATQFVINEVESEYSKGRCPLNVAMEMSWMSHSEAYLSPASIVAKTQTKDPKVVYIEILSLEGTEGWKEFCIVIGKKWMELGGVPHLAKQWEFLPDIHNHIRKKFGNRIDSFKQQLERSGADRNGMFLNEGLKKLLNSA